MDVLLMGPPGVGKGTQAVGLAQALGLVHIASGDLFRANIKAGTPLGLQAKGYIERGELVPDPVVTGMVLERALSIGGSVLDGFPRTSGQARELDARLGERGRAVDIALLLTAPRDALLKRIAGRQTCDTCGESYNVYYQPSRLDLVCDTCGGGLFTRSDDNLDTASHRLAVYEEQTRPVADYYTERGVLVSLDGTGTPEEVADRIVAAIDSESPREDVR